MMVEYKVFAHMPVVQEVTVVINENCLVGGMGKVEIFNYIIYFLFFGSRRDQTQQYFGITDHAKPNISVFKKMFIFV